MSRRVEEGNEKREEKEKNISRKKSGRLAILCIFLRIRYSCSTVITKREEKKEETEKQGKGEEGEEKRRKIGKNKEVECRCYVSS